jgi:putative spermidine/putrescine transport system permease protein
METYRVRWFGRLAGTLLVLFILAPLVVVLMTAFSDAKLLDFPPKGYSTYWLSTLTSSVAWTDSMKMSFKIAGYSCLLAVLLGVPLGLGLARGRLGRSRLVHAFVLAPMIVPVISLSIGFYFVSAKLGILGTMAPLIMADVTLGLPLVVVAVLATVRGLDPALEPAARTLGASMPKVLKSVTLPLLLPGIVAGAVFAFLQSWDDIMNALFLATARTTTFPLRLWNEIHFSLTPIVATAAVLLSVIAMSVVALAGLAYWLRRRSISRQVARNILLRS